MKQLLLIILMIPNIVLAREVSTLIYNVTKNEIIMGSGLNIIRPIASLTKIMTAMVSLDHDGNLQRRIKISGSNKIPSGEYTREELMTAMLVRSDNGAAEALAADYPGGRRAFIRDMNKKAQNIGMNFTKFVDPSGLGSGNISNIGSIGIMLQVSSLYPFIKESSVQKQISIEKRRYTIVLDNTNKPLLYDFDEIILSKTGFTSASGWSVGLILEKHDQIFSVIVLGSPSRDHRYQTTKNLIDRYFQDLDIEKLAEKQRSQYNTGIINKIKNWFYQNEENFLRKSWKQISSCLRIRSRINGCFPQRHTYRHLLSGRTNYSLQHQS